MSFKRTSGKLQGEDDPGKAVFGYVFDQRQEHCGPVFSQPVAEEAGYFPISTVQVPSNVIVHDETQFNLSLSESPPFESMLETLKDVPTDQQGGRLVAREAVLPFRQLEDSTFIDLRSEKSSQTIVVDKKESDKTCLRCDQLKLTIAEKDYKIQELKEHLDYVKERQKLFIVSNCQLNEDIESLKTDNEKLRTELNRLMNENSQLRDDVNRQLQLAAGDSERLQLHERGVTNSNLTNSVQNSSRITNTGKTALPSVKDCLDEAFVLSYKQRSDLKKLQQQVVSQNRTIRMLCQQLQKTLKLSQPKLLPQMYQQASSQKDESSRTGKDIQKRTQANKGWQRFQEHDIDIVTDDEDIYSAAAAFYQVPFTRSDTKIVSNTGDLRHLASGSSSKPHPLARTTSVINPSHAYESQMTATSAQVGGKNLSAQVGGKNLHDAAVGVLETRLTARQRTAPSEVFYCPQCCKEFSGTGIEIKQKFEKHVESCPDLHERKCPMCYKPFPLSIPQAEFERHVTMHFEHVVAQASDFEVLEPPKGSHS